MKGQPSTWQRTRLSSKLRNVVEGGARQQMGLRLMLEGEDVRKIEIRKGAGQEGTGRRRIQNGSY